MLIILLPARPSRLNAMSMPNARRNVCARRSRPASARGLLGQPVRLSERPSLAATGADPQQVDGGPRP